MDDLIDKTILDHHTESLAVDPSGVALLPPPEPISNKSVENDVSFETGEISTASGLRAPEALDDNGLVCQYILQPISTQLVCKMTYQYLDPTKGPYCPDFCFEGHSEIGYESDTSTSSDINIKGLDDFALFNSPLRLANLTESSGSDSDLPQIPSESSSSSISSDSEQEQIGSSSVVTGEFPSDLPDNFELSDDYAVDPNNEDGNPSSETDSDATLSGCLSSPVRVVEFPAFDSDSPSVVPDSPPEFKDNNKDLDVGGELEKLDEKNQTSSEVKDHFGGQKDGQLDQKQVAIESGTDEPKPSSGELDINVVTSSCNGYDGDTEDDYKSDSDIQMPMTYERGEHLEWKNADQIIATNKPTEGNLPFMALVSTASSSGSSSSIGQVHASAGSSPKKRSLKRKLSSSKNDKENSENVEPKKKVGKLDQEVAIDKENQQAVPPPKPSTIAQNRGSSFRRPGSAYVRHLGKTNGYDNGTPKYSKPETAEGRISPSKPNTFYLKDTNFNKSWQ